MLLVFVGAVKLEAESSEGRIRRVKDTRIRFKSIYILEVYLLSRDIYLELILGATDRLSSLDRFSLFG